MARTEGAPQTKRRGDYRPPDFRVEGIDISFDIRDGLTLVCAKTRFIRLNSNAQHLTLDGQGLTLRSVSMNDETLSSNRYATDENTLTVQDVSDAFTLETVVEIQPEKNTALEGLYKSSGNYCTQCEPEGFRKITYYLDRPDVMATFTTRIEADKKSLPWLLSNGNCTEKGDAGNGRHFAVWHDPFPKPSYLFALVAGDLACVQDAFTTMSGRKVDLYIYVNHGNEDKCAHAMKALKDAMKWDEETYGREYDLDLFNIVAVNDFNFGAMENKSLNIFNSKLVLAKPETATDNDYLAIEGVVAHEYFHNWTGNRITCRDWFQLSLKEGLTVFRDQCFSADMNSAATQRIDDVTGLRNTQFPEDASPMAHPIRPDSYIEINNFYTATVYEKGAEIIRMMHTLLGEVPQGYRRGTDLYFQRHDGQAVTCDDFVQCMQDANPAAGIDWAQFRLWYAQAGTPEVSAAGVYDANKKTYALTLKQKTPGTAGQANKKPVYMPILVGLLGKDGKDLLPEKTRMLKLKDAEQVFVFENIAEKPVPSILRGFSAPVKLTTDLTDDALLFLMAHDSDGFNRWDAGQTYLQRIILSKPKTLPDALLNAFGRLIADERLDRALLAKALSLPSEAYLSQLTEHVDIEALHTARHLIMTRVGQQHAPALEKLYRAQEEKGAYSVTPKAMGKRRLKNILLHYLYAADVSLGTTLALQQYKTATNMTDKAGALSVLAESEAQGAKEAFDDFYRQWKDDPLVLDKWFALQALADRKDAPEKVAQLLSHPDFTYKNPNRLRALVGSFAAGNPRWFHRADGAGYGILADTVLKMNDINPQTAARLLNPLRQWRKFDAARQSLMEVELSRILSEKGISNDVYEIVSKSLGKSAHD